MERWINTWERWTRFQKKFRQNFPERYSEILESLSLVFSRYISFTPLLNFSLDSILSIIDSRNPVLIFKRPFFTLFRFHDSVVLLNSFPRSLIVPTVVLNLRRDQNLGTGVENPLNKQDKERCRHFTHIEMDGTDEVS